MFSLKAKVRLKQDDEITEHFDKFGFNFDVIIMPEMWYVSESQLMKTPITSPSYIMAKPSVRETL